MTRPVDLTTRRWLGLCGLAEAAAADPARHAGDLSHAASGMVRHQPPAGAAPMALALSLRWAATAFGAASLLERQQLAAGLASQARVLRDRLSPPGPREAAAGLPVPPAHPAGGDEADPAWTRRADIGG